MTRVLDWDDYGLFRYSNKNEDWMNYSEIYGGLAPSLMIQEVPDSVNPLDIIRFLQDAGICKNFKAEYGGHEVLKRNRWPVQNCRFSAYITYKELVRRASIAITTWPDEIDGDEFD